MAEKNYISSNARHWLVLAVASAILLLVGWLGANASQKSTTREFQQHLAEKAELFKSYLEGELDKVGLVSDMLAHHPLLETVLLEKNNNATLFEANQFLKHTNDKLKTSDIFVMDTNGLTIAASNYEKEKTFIGKNYAFRPYFTQAMEEEKGEFVAIGITSNKLGYYISRAIYSDKKLLGVVVAKIDFDQLRNLTNNQHSDFAIADNKGVIFFSSNENFTLKSLGTISAKNRLYIARTKQYPIARITPLNLKTVKGELKDATSITISNKKYLFNQANLEGPDWSIMMISSVRKIQNTAITTGVLIASIVFILFVASYMIYKRRQDNTRLQTIVENLPSGVTLFEDDLQMLICNEKLKDLLDFPPEYFRNGLPNMKQLLKYNADRGEYGPGDPDRLTREALEKISQKQDHVFERTRPNGTVLEVRGKWLENAFVTTYTDITDRKMAEDKAKRNASYLQALLQNLDQGVTVIDENLDIIFWNKAFFSLLELPDHLMKPVMRYEDLIRYNAERGEYGPGDPEQQVQMRVQASLKFEPHHFERTRPDGRTLEVIGKPLTIDGKSVGFITTYVDITEHKRMAVRLRQMANTDVLTETNNRRHFTSLLSREIKRCERTGHSLSILLLDVDHFKSINDNYGHGVGDQVLKKFTKTCEEALRNIDIMGRMGGEEFCIFMPETGRDGAFVLAERIRQSVEKMTLEDDHGEPVTITVSIGVGIYDTVLDDRVEDLIKRADKALYQAKSRGRNMVC
ncbi:PAS-domain containing protein [Terasakiella sp. A23]|uniref:PAS-domain containing protein n=1 Tax=Terasakiella sp. FCG-A23 TaxID=3080561 RepID=UPI0029531E4A|nr:PAS-domain containing protein [Terasakiella sp. A23]MDV7339920.1 PAS-domain containing protein [Terasakiella sp. A23]